MILPMSKVEIIGKKSDYHRVLSLIHALGCVEIEDIKKELVPGDLSLRPFEPEESVAQEKQNLEALLVKVNSILSFMQKKQADKKRIEDVVDKYWMLSNEKLLKTAETVIQNIDKETREITEKLTQYESELSLLNNFEIVISKVEPLVRHFSSVKGYETTALLVERKHRAILDLIYDEIKKIAGDKFEIATADVDEKTTAALIFYPKEYSHPIHNLLWEENVGEIKLPKDFSDMPFDEAVKAMKNRLKELPEKIKKLREELDNKTINWVDELLAIKNVIENRIQEYQILDHIGQTEFAFVIIGWTPKKYLKNITRAIAKTFGNRVIVNELELAEEELKDAPVCLENPLWAKAYEMVLKMWALPKYGTFDPTPMVGFFYSLFFGIILGDVGYGIVLLLTSLFLIYRFKEKPGIRAIGFMFLGASIMVIIFGFLFGEFFGDLGLKLHLVKHFELKIASLKVELPLERDKPEFIMPLLIICLSLGIGQILLGQFIGIINGLRERSKHHILEKAGMVLLFVSIGLIAISSSARLPKAYGPLSVLALITAVALIGYGGGVIGVVHIFSTFGKIFSYIRLMALGLAGVILAIAANKIGESVGSIWMGIAIASIFHLINLVVHSFSSTIHSLRLNLVEFLPQFYEEGKREFKPFKKTEV